ncbi:MAG: hypothetical protein ACHP8A_16255 [Terriglobales bacterium]
MSIAPDAQGCPHCGGELEFLEKNSFTGRVFRDYWCAKCERVITEDDGVALWQVLHDANQAERDAAAAPSPADTQRRRPWWKFWK